MKRERYTKMNPRWKPLQKPVKWIHALTPWRPVKDIANLLQINHYYSPVKAWKAALMDVYFRQEHGNGMPHHTIRFYVKVDDEMLFITRYDIRTDRPSHHSRNAIGDAKTRERSRKARNKRDWKDAGMMAVGVNGKVVQLNPDEA